MKTEPNHPSNPTENGLIYDHSGSCINKENVGLTKREHFAAIAMQGLLSNNSVYQGYSTPQQQAELSLAHADALIEALNKDEQ